MDIETCVGCGTEDNVWVFGRCTKCWLSRDEPPECDGCRYGYLNQQGHMGPGGCLKTDSLNSDESGAPAPSESSQMYMSRSRSPSPPPSSPCEKMYFCIQRHCHNPVERSGDDCKKCIKPKTFSQISDGYHCAFEECPTCDPAKRDTEPGTCKTCQCDECGNIFFLKGDDSFTGVCYDCKQCSMCETNFDQFGICLQCRKTSPCRCGRCVRCNNLRRLAAPKLCPCGEESVSDLWLQCVDCYYDERKHRFSE